MSRARAPQAVVFDIGRVLFHWNLRHLFEKLIDDAGELDWFLRTVVTEEWHFQSDGGVPLAHMLDQRIAQFPQYERHIRAYAARFNETIPGPVAGVGTLVERLHAKGIPLFCLTNFGAEFWERFRPTCALFDLFDDIVVSGVERVVKPESRIYEICEERSGYSRAQLFFTDDNAANIDAARARGWQAHLFTDAKVLERQLQSAGLL